MLEKASCVYVFRTGPDMQEVLCAYHCFFPHSSLKPQPQHSLCQAELLPPFWAHICAIETRSQVPVSGPGTQQELGKCPAPVTRLGPPGFSPGDRLHSRTTECSLQGQAWPERARHFLSSATLLHCSIIHLESAFKPLTFSSLEFF